MLKSKLCLERYHSISIIFRISFQILLQSLKPFWETSLASYFWETLALGVGVLTEGSVRAPLSLVDSFFKQNYFFPLLCSKLFVYVSNFFALIEWLLKGIVFFAELNQLVKLIWVCRQIGILLYRLLGLALGWQIGHHILVRNGLTWRESSAILVRVHADWLVEGAGLGFDVFLLWVVRFAFRLRLKRR